MADITKINLKGTELNIKDAGAARTSDLAAKQDAISDLAAIRSGAALGSTSIQSVKTINNTSIVGTGNVTIDTYASTSTTQDGTFIITLTSGDTVTVDLNHVHTQYVKYQLLADEAAYTAITTKDSATLYLIPETSS